MNNQLISIIIPVYNGEKYIKTCLESIINQTYDNLEIIVVIDGATDNTLNICKKYAENDSRIKIFYKENEGVQTARKYGFEKSTGESIFFVDSDDWIDLNTIETLKRNKEKFDSDIVRIGVKEEFLFKENILNISEDNSKFISKIDFKEMVYNKFMLRSDFINIWGQLISKRIISSTMFDTSLIIGEDFDFNVKLYDKANGVVIIKNPYYHYRKNMHSVTHKSINNLSVLKQKIDSLYISYTNLIVYSKKWKIGEEQKKKAALHLLNGISELICNYIVDYGHNKRELIDNITNIIKNNKIYEITKKIEQEEIEASNLKYKKVISFLKQQEISGILRYATVQYKYKKNIKRILMKIIGDRI